MKDTRSIEEQVMELTVEQRKKMLIVGCVVTVLEIIGGVAGLVFILSNTLVILTTASTAIADKAMLMSGITMIVMVVYIAVLFIILKLTCPYYGDKKMWYIIKHKLYM